MTDINAGDWVVAHKGTHWTCDVSKVIEVDLPYIKIEQPFGFNTAKWRSVDDFRPATPAESAAGHRIDESVCTCPSGDGSLRWPCPAHPKDGATAREGEKEAVIANAGVFPLPLFRRWLHDEIGISDCYKTYSDEFLRRDAQDMYLGAKWAWQHQQAVVDEKRDEIEYLKAERKREQESSWATHDEQVGIIRQQDGKIKELQKHIDELRKLPPIIHTIIVKDGDTHWFAQALNIDYAACGMSLDDVQANFEKGLRGTIDANLNRFKNISRIVTQNGADVEHVLSMTDSQQRRIEELQKRVGATTTALRELQAFLSENSGIARSKFNADADTYFDGCADAFDMVEQEVKSVLVKALGADHETP